MSAHRIPLAGVIGAPIAHSRSPRLFAHWLADLGIAGHYVPMHVEPEDFAQVVRTLPRMGFRGTNVTLPHKHAALQVADHVSARAARIGAVSSHPSAWASARISSISAVMADPRSPRTLRRTRSSACIPLVPS